MNEATSPGKAYKILLIEDEEFLRRIFKARMVAEGYQVTDVGSAEKGLEYLVETTPDLIILDLYLPQMNGFQFLERLKANPAQSKTPVLILSGLGQETDIRKGLELGAKEFVVKTNVSPRELLDKIHRMVAGESGSPQKTG